MVRLNRSTPSMESIDRPFGSRLPHHRNAFNVPQINMIKSIFFCKFDIHKGELLNQASRPVLRHQFKKSLTYLLGPVVHHQVPLHSITPSPLSSTPPLFDFKSYASYLIPRQSFCSLSTSFCTPAHRVLSHPICISSSHYPRNEFLFAFALVLSISTPAHPYIPIVTKLSTLFSTLEQQSCFLSTDGSAPNTGPVFAICEILREDLNIYSECMIPVDDSNSLNIKLFPTYPPPPSISPHHVPLSTVQLDTLTDHNWDLTMLLILPFIDGVNSVKRIAQLADADYKLVRIAIAHLLYYGCITLLDVFHFGASYAVTAELGSFVSDKSAQEECRRYVAIPDTGLPRNLGDQVNHIETKGEAIDGTRLVELYASFKQGHSLRNWCVEHADVLEGLDVRRLVTFGVIKGFLYRVSKYGVLMPNLSKWSKGSMELLNKSNRTQSKQETLTRDPIASYDTQEEQIRDGENGCTGPGNSYRRKSGRKNSQGQVNAVDVFHDMSQYLGGLHSFDEICTKFEISEKDLIRRLRDIKDVQFLQK